MKSTLLQVRISPEEKALYAEVAERLQRNLSDAVRVTMREKLQALREQEQVKGNETPARGHSN